MKATAIKSYRCICQECDPLPTIEGLHPLTYPPDPETETRKPKGFLGIIADRVMPLRRQD
ncbi:MULTISPECIES: hypothetical protein [Rhizobium]|jgi:hypothetical protein|uniref:Uncharacterized protein n=1 Tax=Rhizobium anhuiense TaxID=1184720 RepID=A0A432NV70_9HYPH|nr:MULTISPECIES: hypothetical protein [Rhizobium]KZS54298.1 hypothetical protein AS890_19390 [Rhizobium anhuiense bv. trifolii]MBB3297002.1 hypothetical protein [Rhizobium sp. BK112]MBB3366217.1 hypothetical protein [Rhizobium sp. BK077]MBB3741195.1 hypothetical protein [Rhizobium sp. BK591]MBB4111099.1 hypothetical protein [Rhizobium sp. BK226]